MFRERRVFSLNKFFLFLLCRQARDIKLCAIFCSIFSFFSKISEKKVNKYQYFLCWASHFAADKFCLFRTVSWMYADIVFLFCFRCVLRTTSFSFHREFFDFLFFFCATINKSRMIAVFCDFFFLDFIIFPKNWFFGIEKNDFIYFFCILIMQSIFSWISFFIVTGRCLCKIRIVNFPWTKFFDSFFCSFVGVSSVKWYQYYVAFFTVFVFFF